MEDIIEQWNKAAQKFTDGQENSEYAESNKRVVRSRFEHFNGEKLLDIGCGYGFYTDYFRSIGANAIGIDGSEKMIEIAREQYPLTEFYIIRQSILHFMIVTGLKMRMNIITLRQQKNILNLINSKMTSGVRQNISTARYLIT